MSYTKTTWASGDVITSEKLNNIEDGIAQAQQTADTANARETLADLTDVKITETPSTGSLLRFGYTPDGDKWQPYTLPNYMNQWQWINESPPNENRLMYNANVIYSWLGNSNGNMYRVKIGKRILAMTEYYADLVNTIYEFRFGDVVYRATAGNEKPVVVEDGISAISDVDITTPTDGQILTYDATNSEWVNGDANSGAEYVNVYGTDGALAKNFNEIVSLVEAGKTPYIEVTTEYVKAASGHSPSFTLQKGKHYLTGINIVGSTDYRRVFFSNYEFESYGTTGTLTFQGSANSINGLVGVMWGSSTSNGSVLTYNGTTHTWSPAENTINNLTDVDTSSLTNGDVLTYNSTSEKWENATPSATPEMNVWNTSNNGTLSMTGAELEALLSTTKLYIQLTSNYTKNVVLNGKTINLSLTPGIYYLDAFEHPTGTSYRNFYFNGHLFKSSTNSDAPKLTYNNDNVINNLNNVIITSPTNGQTLTYNGSLWVNASTANALSGLSDVHIDAPYEGQLLGYDSQGRWVNVDNSATGNMMLKLGIYTDTNGDYGNANRKYLFIGTEFLAPATFENIEESVDSGYILYLIVNQEYYALTYFDKNTYTAVFGSYGFKASTSEGMMVYQSNGCSDNTTFRPYYYLSSNTLVGPGVAEVFAAYEANKKVDGKYWYQPDNEYVNLVGYKKYINDQNENVIELFSTPVSYYDSGYKMRIYAVRATEGETYCNYMIYNSNVWTNS